jgi:adenine/guanine phosphoribosyltransferase-like PRPP-binding protein
MLLKRHDISLEGKKVILSEDIVTKGSTLTKMKKIVEEGGGDLVAITCIGNRS